MNLGNGAMKGWWGPTQARGTVGRFPWWPIESEPALPAGHQTSAVTLKELQWKYLSNTVPVSDLQQGWEAQGSKFASEAMEKIHYDGKGKADGE